MRKKLVLVLLCLLIVSFIDIVGSANNSYIKLTDPLSKPILDSIKDLNKEGKFDMTPVLASSYANTYSTTHFRVHYNTCATWECVTLSYAQKVGTWYASVYASSVPSDGMMYACVS